jgi:hypothetical protein
MGRYNLYDNKTNEDYLLDNSEIMIDLLKRLSGQLSIIMYLIWVAVIAIGIVIVKVW